MITARLDLLPVCLRLWFFVVQINFVGEDGVDAGGVFREGISRMVEDLFSPDFDLFIQCPNGRQAIGQVKFPTFHLTRLLMQQ